MILDLTPSAILSQIRSSLSLSVPENKITPIRILVAFSGGLDSHVLLHLLSKISSEQISLRAIYINHGLQTVADGWVQHCAIVCNKLAITYDSIDLNLSIAKGESTEQVARNARYNAFNQVLLENEVLVTAHHQNDQAETVLLQLFRGAGVTGLAAMPIKNSSNSNKNIHLRPLLNYSRYTLESYAQAFDLNYIEDPSNKDESFDRNFLRQAIMPKLRKRWVGIDKTISRAATIQAETKQLLDEVAADELPRILSKAFYYSIETNERALAPLHIPSLNALSLNKQRLLLRYWISQQGFNYPSNSKLEHIFTDLIEAAKDKQPLIAWSGAELRRYQDCLSIMSPLSNHDANQVIDWDLESTVEIKSLALSLKPEYLSKSNIKNKNNITIRFRTGGEKVELPKRGVISLKNYFQEQKVPPWIRTRLPLIYENDKLIKIIGLNSAKRHPPPFFLRVHLRLCYILVIILSFQLFWSRCFIANHGSRVICF